MCQSGKSGVAVRTEESGDFDSCRRLLNGSPKVLAQEQLSQGEAVPFLGGRRV